MANPAQQALWALMSLPGNSAAFHLSRVVRVEGRVDLAALRAAAGRLAAVTPVLRTALQGDGVPEFLSVPNPPPPEEWVRDERGGNPAAALTRCMQQPFDLQAPPPIRVHLISDGEDGSELVFVGHHLLLDGTSFTMLTDDLLVCLRTGNDPPGRRSAEGVPVPVYREAEPQDWLPVLQPLPAHRLSFRGQVAEVDRPPYVGACRDLSPAAVAAVAALRREHNISDSSVLLSVFAAALHKLFDLSDLLVMTQVDTRTAGQRGAVGMYVNTLPVRSQLGEDSWADFLSRTHEAVCLVLEKRHVPLREVLALVNPERRSDGSSVFGDFEFSTFRPPLDSSPDAPGRPWTDLPQHDPGTLYRVSMNVVLAPGCMTVKWAADGADFESSDLDRLHRCVELLLLHASAAAQDNRGPAGADVLAPDELSEVISLGTGRSAEISLSGPAERFLEHARQTPGQLAVKQGDQTCSYGELRAWVEEICAVLAETGVRPGDQVAVLCERGAGHIAAILAVLHLGAVYVPIDPAAPSSRVGDIFAAVPCAVLVRDTVAGIAAAIDTWPAEIALPRQPTAGSAAGRPPLRAPEVLGLSHPAYVLMTSGSTGTPKAVEVGLGAFHNHLVMMEEAFALTRADCVAQTAPVAFDIHLWQCVVPVMVGGTCVVYPDAALLKPVELLKGLHADGVTVLELVPSHLKVVLDAQPTGDAGSLPKLRYLISTGEQLPSRLARRMRAAFPDAGIVNAYGPAEAADDVTLGTVTGNSEAGSVAIGWPQRNAAMTVVDRWGRLRPPGFVGELAIGGPVLANGYLNDPASRNFAPDPYRPGARIYLTGDRCLLDPVQGFVYVGRDDGQVKVAGRRLELGDVEAALHALPGVRDAVVSLGAGAASSRLVARITVDSPTTTPVSIRAGLSARLPAWMIPQEIVLADRLPVGRTGKLRRTKEPHPEPSWGAARAEDALARRLAPVWLAALPPESSLDEGFFQAGGDSLRAVEMITRMRRTGLPVSVRDLYERQTFAGFLDRVRAVAGAAPDLFAPIRGLVPATPRQRDMLSAMSRGALPALQAVIFDVAPADLPEMLAALVDRYEELRLCFRQDGEDGWVVDLSPDGDEAVPLRWAEVTTAGLGRPEAQRALLRAAAAQLDPGRGWHLGLARGDAGTTCLVVSHLVCDLVSVHVLAAEIAAAATPGPGAGPTSDFRNWMGEVARESLRPPSPRVLAYRAEVTTATADQNERLASSRDRLAAPRHSRVSAATQHGSPSARIAWSDLGRKPDLLALAVAAAAKAWTSVVGPGRVRVDIDSSAREAFAGRGSHGSGMGCYTVLTPVVLLVAPGMTMAELVRQAQLILVAMPPMESWDCSGGDADDDRTLPIPLVNVVGRTTGRLPLGTGGSASIPDALRSWNAGNDRHAVTLDLVVLPSDGGDEEVVAQVTERAGWEWAMAPFGEALAGALHEVANLGASAEVGPLPDGLDLLGLGAADLGELLQVTLPSSDDVR